MGNERGDKWDCLNAIPLDRRVHTGTRSRLRRSAEWGATGVREGFQRGPRICVPALPQGCYSVVELVRWRPSAPGGCSGPARRAYRHRVGKPRPRARRRQTALLLVPERRKRGQNQPQRHSDTEEAPTSRYLFCASSVPLCLSDCSSGRWLVHLLGRFIMLRMGVVDPESGRAHLEKRRKAPQSVAPVPPHPRPRGCS
jgi:hypothetical protein